jgi:hypothetical protein
MQLEIEWIGLLERASDGALMDHLGHTAERGGGLRAEVWPAEVWPRVAALVARVARLPARASTAAWIAHETSRAPAAQRDDAPPACSTQAATAADLSDADLERARIEQR